MDNHQTLTTEERLALLDVLENPQRLAVLRKVWALEADFWKEATDSEALSAAPNTNKIIGHASRADQMKQNEAILRRALERKAT